MWKVISLILLLIGSYFLGFSNSSTYRVEGQILFFVLLIFFMVFAIIFVINKKN